MPKPRNLTAAAYNEVIANPPAAHIKDSVANTAPGLELDERTFEKHLFPGLVLEFQRYDQDEDKKRLLMPVVRAIDQDKTGVTVDGAGGILSFKVDDPESYLFVYAIRSLDGPAPQIYRFYDFRQDVKYQREPRQPELALDCWNAIRNMPCPEGGRVGLLIGTGDLKGDKWKKALRAFEALAPANAVTRQSKDKAFAWAVVVVRRAPLEDARTGLIFPNVPPGDLQSTMCTPWHYDFRDCHCYYWASSRPDMVSGEGPEERNVHFMRKRKPVWEKIPIPPEVWGANPNFASEAKNVAEQEKVLWNHIDTINDWETLPVVLNDTEVRSRYRKVVEKLQVLAGIEHALAVEYLYAYQSVDPAFRLDGDELGARARDVLRRIAVDEMHHFRWVNEILQLLREQLGPASFKALAASGDRTMTVIDRATNYGPNFDWRSFGVRRLELDTLDWFIRIERPSRQERADEQLEGLYISIARSIREEFEENGDDSAFGNAVTVQKIQSLIKLIIEEGDGHYRQLADLRNRLFDRGENVDHLRTIKEKPASHEIALARRVSDTLYHVLLYGLGHMFMRGDDEDGGQVRHLVELMEAMDALNNRLAHLGYPACFNPPDPSTTQEWKPWGEALKQDIDDLKDALKKTMRNEEELRKLAGPALDKAARCWEPT